MRIIIVGGGKLGYYLARDLIEKGHNISIIEKKHSRCIKISEGLDTEVICGDGTEIQTLIDADISKADCFVSVTGKDQDNLVACQLAKDKFLIEKVIARVNNPRNAEVVQELGIDNIINSTDILTRMIQQEIDNSNIRLLTKLSNKELSIFSVIIPNNSKVKNKKVRDLNFPKGSIIVSIIRNEESIVPQGDTEVFVDDEVIVVSENLDQQSIEDIFKQ